MNMFLFMMPHYSIVPFDLGQKTGTVMSRFIVIPNY